MLNNLISFTYEKVNLFRRQFSMFTLSFSRRQKIRYGDEEIQREKREEGEKESERGGSGAE